MSEVNAVAEKLGLEIGKYGASKLTYATSLFSGKAVEKADISGSINGNSFRVIMFDASDDVGLPSVSAHFTLNMNKHQLSAGHIEYWNSDNRFTKIYRQDEDVLLVMDVFLSISGGEDVLRSAAGMWNIALKEISKFKSSYDRRAAMRDSSHV